MTYKSVKNINIYEGRVFNVHKETILFPNGNEHDLDIIVHPGAVAILPIDEAGNIYFVNQYRHATGGMFLEIPAGGLEEGEAARDCAVRELQEEIGMAPGKLEKLLEVYIAPGYSTEIVFLYLATALMPSSLPQDDDEDIEIILLSLNEAFERIEKGQIKDAKSILALTYARPLLK